MKTSFLFLALAAAAGFSCAVLALSAGTSILSIVAPESLVGLFVVSFVGLISASDYASKSRRRAAHVALVIAPPASAFAGRATTVERLAA